jgi:hypothetical protein
MYLRVDVTVLYTANPLVAAAAQRSGVHILQAACNQVSCTSYVFYEVLSKTFRTGGAIYTSVVVARSTGLNRPNCEFRVLLRRFAATAWKRAKMSPRTLARTGLAASPWQRSVSHFRRHPAVSGEIQNSRHLTPIVLPWFGTLDISKNQL